jgi:hypothetical protein
MVKGFVLVVLLVHMTLDKFNTKSQIIMVCKETY